MENLNLEKAKIEGQFGLLLRETENHDNYVLINFEDLDKIVDYYDEFKSRGIKDIQNNESKKFDDIKVKRISEKISIIKDEISVLQSKKVKFSNEYDSLLKKDGKENRNKIIEYESMLKSIERVLEEQKRELEVWETKLNELS
jgi:predicted RNase H-like nuclease (RuvC/YqgF family)